MQLSDRMRAVVELAQPCRCIADIGCDHGYVAMELVRSRKCRRVIAMDVNKGPLERARRNIRDYGMQDYIETRLSDGTQALRPGEADGMVCAGMGGRLMLSILAQGEELVRDMKQVILQPQSEIREVRSFLRENGFLIEQEDIICEDGKYYPMMRVLPGTLGKREGQLMERLERKSRQLGNYKNGIPGYRRDFSVSEISKGEAERLTRVQDTYGPCLLEMGHPTLKRYLLWRKENYDQIRRDLLAQGRQDAAHQQERIAQLDEELSDIVFCLYSYFK